MRRRILITLLVAIIMVGTTIVVSDLWLHNPSTPAAVSGGGEPTLNRSGADTGQDLPSPSEPAVGDEASPDPEPVGVLPEPDEIVDNKETYVPAGGVSGVNVASALNGEFDVHSGSVEAPTPGAPTFRLSVEVEQGLPIAPEEFGDFVLGTLNDERSWAENGRYSFARTDEDSDIRVLLASPATVDRLCAPLATNERWSCGREGRIVVNADRWINGASAFSDAGGELEEYRYYIINHEMGHLLGYDHKDCPSSGALAPIMLQQSITLQGCVPNGWPSP